MSYAGGGDPRAFPRAVARTKGFRLGLPRTFTVAPDGSRVVFLRSGAGDDPVNALWAFDVARAAERCVFDPRASAEVGSKEEELPPEERARRERAGEAAGEAAGGIVAYATDRDVRVAAFALNGRPMLADLLAGGARGLTADGAVYDPRPDPAGSRIGCVVSGALHVIDAASGEGRVIAADDDPDVSWGVADFIAAEEMDRPRGYWWSPDGTVIAATRADVRGIPEAFLSNPTDPSGSPRAIRYPFAGGPNPDVSLHLLPVKEGHRVQEGDRVEVEWDRERLPYLARVLWKKDAPLTLLVQTRDQRTTQVLEVDPGSGRTTLLREDRDDAWVQLAEGMLDRLPDGRLVHLIDADDTRRLAIDGKRVTPPRLQVRSIVHTGGDGVIVQASEEPTEIHLWRVAPGGEVERITTRPGVHAGAAGGDILVITSRTLDDELPETTVLRGGEPVAPLASNAERPPLRAHPSFFSAGARELRSALLLPGGEIPSAPQPVLMDPYGGPHGQVVLRARGAFLESQWFADQGFAVLAVDGRGTPGRGTSWERSVQWDLAGAALEDQVDALHAAAERHPGVLDLSRVAMRGWSFGGYLSALAVLRRPDVFHAAIVGAPVTDWRLYDTHYTERYLGTPQEHPDAYERTSVLRDADSLSRPIMLVHGLSDDNVLAANTLRFAAALFEAERPHELYLLPKVSHRGGDVEEQLLMLQLGFLRRALGLDGTRG